MVTLTQHQSIHGEKPFIKWDVKASTKMPPVTARRYRAGPFRRQPASAIWDFSDPVENDATPGARALDSDVGIPQARNFL